MNAVRGPTPVRPAGWCPAWVANTDLLTAQIALLRGELAAATRTQQVVIAPRRYTLKMQGDGDGI